MAVGPDPIDVFARPLPTAPNLRNRRRESGALMRSPSRVELAGEVRVPLTAPRAGSHCPSRLPRVLVTSSTTAGFPGAIRLLVSLESCRYRGETLLQMRKHPGTALL